MRIPVSTLHRLAGSRPRGVGATGSIAATCPDSTYTQSMGLCLSTTGGSLVAATCASGYTINATTGMCDPNSGTAAGGASPVASTAAPAATTGISTTEVVVFGGLAVAAIYALTKF